LSPSKGEAHVETFLERAKGSALDITVKHKVPVNTITLLSSHTRQIRSLKFLSTAWMDIQMLSEIISGPLPFLQTLDITIMYEKDRGDSSSPLFNNAANLTVFRFDSYWSPLLNCFRFSNLTFFDLSTELYRMFHASQLLDFLEASPMLRTVHMKLTVEVFPDQISRRRVVVLPNLENFNLVFSGGGPGYKIAAHISCPSARCVRLTQNIEAGYEFPEEIFPDLDSWHAIVSQYSRSPVEEATLELVTIPVVTCKLSFLSPDPNVIELCFQVTDEDNDDLGPPSEEMCDMAFTQAMETVGNHPQLANLKRLCVRHNYRLLDTMEILNFTDEVGQLFGSMGPLDELTISHSDLRPYFLPPFEEPVTFPKIKELTISHPIYISPEKHKTAIVAFARRQHALGIPLERVIIRGGCMPAGLEEGLRQLVGSVEYRYEELFETGDYQATYSLHAPSLA
jgi:hypothetical protein